MLFRSDRLRPGGEVGCWWLRNVDLSQVAHGDRYACRIACEDDGVRNCAVDVGSLVGLREHAAITRRGLGVQAIHIATDQPGAGAGDLDR